MADRNEKNDDAMRRKNGAACTPETPAPEVDSLDTSDPVDEASYDSFPASDPPAHTGTRARPSANDDKH